MKWLPTIFFVVLAITLLLLMCGCEAKKSAVNPILVPPFGTDLMLVPEGCMIGDVETTRKGIYLSSHFELRVVPVIPGEPNEPNEPVTYISN